MGDTPYQKLKGDPDVVRSKAQHYQNIADAIQRSTITLKKVQDMEGMKSKAVSALKESAKSTADDIDKAHDRYDKTAKALITYSGKLRSAQDAADVAITHINEKQGAATTAHTAADKAHQTAESASDDDKGDASDKADKAGDAADAADKALAAAHQEWHNAVEDKNNAAEDAIKAIVDVVDHHNNGLKNPSWWDDFVDIVKKIGDIAGVLAIFLSWVPILGQILLVIAVISAIVNLADAIVKFANGEGSFWSVLGAAVGAVLTIFGGRIFTFLGKAARVRGLTRVRKLPGGGIPFGTSRRVLAGKRIMSSARQQLFKMPSRSDFTLRSIWSKALASGSGDRAAYKALFTGEGGRMRGLQNLAGINNNVVSSVKHMVKTGEYAYNIPAAAMGLHQLNSTYNKVADLVNAPNAVSHVFGGGDVTPSLPTHSEGGLIQKGADAIPGGYISHN